MPLNRDDPDWAFDIFFFFIWFGPLIAAILWSPWWLLCYIPVAIICGL